MIDFSKPVETKDGRKVRVLTSTMKNPEYPVVVIITDAEGNEYSETYAASGALYNHRDDAEDDLVNVPEKRTLWLDIFDDGSAVGFTTEDQARRGCGGRKIVSVEYTV